MTTTDESLAREYADRQGGPVFRSGTGHFKCMQHFLAGLSAQRERDARIAEEELSKWNGRNNPSASVQGATGACARIAKAIREGK